MNVFKLSKGAMALFLSVSALVSCKKETGTPAATNNNTTQQARAGGLNQVVRSGKVLQVKIAEKYVNNSSTKQYGQITIFATCNLTSDKAPQRIVSVKVEKFIYGNLLSGAAATATINKDKTYANVGFATVISDRYTKGNADPMYIGFSYKKDINDYYDFTIANFENYFTPGEYSAVKNTMQYEISKHCAFHLDEKGWIQFRDRN